MNTSTRPSRRAWMLVMILATITRIAWSVMVPVAPISDCTIYDGAAQRLADGLPYTVDALSQSLSAYWPVGTSFMYSLVYRLFDPLVTGYSPVVALNVVVSLAVVALSMILGSRWGGARAGIITGVMVALWPMHIQFTTIIASEPVFTAALLGGLVAWPAHPHRPLLPVAHEASDGSIRAGSSTCCRRGARLVLAALLFATATYTRPTALLCPLILSGIECLRARCVIVPAVRAAIATLVLLAAIAPWTIRNYGHFNQLVLVSSNGGSNMWMGNNPDTTGYYQQPPPIRADQDEAQWSRDLGNQAKVYIRQQPVAFVTRSLVKAVKLHDRETIGIAWNLDGLRRVSPWFDTGAGATVLKIVSSGYWYVMLALAAAGAMILVLREGAWKTITHPAIVFFAYFTAVHAIMVIQDRYHFPITPMVAALASFPIAAVLNRRASHGSSPP